ncbi:5-formyltetrahydrofolate cyclo-ligase [Deinococcus yavapaiensis]|uniref:5-formyltetrahydrofolate cyclo-ligase n=1 Tax=Deinococcus yavapaiensis KR-236 TaxID=694435 RepID=A0A318S760_9DEIO|nr:5-formyltetrahydrofolate cyclo-ligase [Deinococcus yavapaiensis]PYE53625.1 5-formyltetrahydrofolate cyclo-ligase [Deinococcus yavapaiensis KR-236]
MTKAELRAWASQRRREVPDASSALTAHLADWLEASGARTVLAYRALPSEPDVSELSSAFELLTTRTIWAPRRALTVHVWSSATERDRFGILQPPLGTPDLPKSAADVVLVPGLAFDRRGGRLGTGGGFYDRLLAGWDVPTVGVTWTELLVDEVPLEPHDVRVRFVATQDGVFDCERAFARVVC